VSAVIPDLICKGCGGLYVPGEEIHLCYGMHPEHPLEKCAPTLARFWESDAFYRLIVGPVGSGKSSVCVNEILRRGLEMPPCRDGIRRSRFAVVRNTYRELADTTKPTFDQWVPPAEGPAYSCVWNKNDFKATVRIGEDVHIEILFRALDKPGDVEKLRSMELSGAYVNEGKEVPKAAWDMLGNRVGRFPAREDLRTAENPEGTYWFGVWGDTQPPDTDHWMYRIFEEEKPRTTIKLDGLEIEVAYELFHQPSGLAPEAENIPFLQPGYYQRQLLGKDQDWIDVNIRSMYGFVREGKPVYPEYRDDRHCKPVRPDPMLPIVMGMDFGLTPAVVLAQRPPAIGQLQVFDELVSEDMGAVSFAQELKRKIQADYPGRPLRGWGDPAGEGRNQVDERTPFDVLGEVFKDEHGRPVFGPAPTNDVRRRLEGVKGGLMRLTFSGDPALVIDPKCKILRKGFIGGYCRARVKVAGEERYHDEPLKNRFSHVHDGLQYVCVGEGLDDRAIYGTKNRKVKVNIRVKRAVKGW
jgi:hypothetical protein